MKKSAVVALFAFAMLPFSACSNNGDQAAYMKNSSAESNAREAEQAEEEFAQLAAKEESSGSKVASKTPEKSSEKAAEKTDKKAGKKVADKKSDKKPEKKATKVAATKTDKKTDKKTDQKSEKKSEKTVAKAEVKAEAKPAAKPEKTDVKVAAQKPVTTEKSAPHETKKQAAPAETKTAKADVPSKRAPASTHASNKTWTVQLGAFRVKENAEKLTSTLKSQGFPVMMLDKAESKSGNFYLVHLEPTPNKSEAQKWQTDLKLKSFDSTLTMKRD